MFIVQYSLHSVQYYPPPLPSQAATSIDHPICNVHRRPLEEVLLIDQWTLAAVFYTPGDPDLILDCVHI